MSETVISDVATKAIVPLGRERPTKKPETRSLRLTADKPIELILGNGHAFNLRRGKDGVVRISMNNFQLPDPDNAGVLINELNLPAYACVDIRRTGCQPARLAIEKITAHDESLGRQTLDFHIDLPDRLVNSLGENVDFTDIGKAPMPGLSIMVGVGGRRGGDNMVFITNHDGGFGVAAPEKSLPREGPGRNLPTDE